MLESCIEQSAGVTPGQAAYLMDVERRHFGLGLFITLAKGPDPKCCHSVPLRDTT